VTFLGRYYRLSAFPGLPTTVQRPRPPILIGGGARPILSLAGREADVASVNPVLPGLKAGDDRRIAWLDGASIATAVRTVRDAARDAGRPVGEPRLQVSVLVYDIQDGTEGRVTGRSSLAPGEWTDLGPLRGLPGVLVGSVDECCDQLREWREVYGFSDIHVGANANAFAGIVDRLSGR
jgi:alkanesulfonate monooxygenase SsuD/methylene tetrahydromethanopterin reductase-like flavin-dependent oxidoreductase (luciferase family)